MMMMTKIPITEQIKVPPPPSTPPPTPEVIGVVEDEEEVEETVIESTGADQEEIVEVEEVELKMILRMSMSHLLLLKMYQFFLVVKELLNPKGENVLRKN